MHIAIIIKTAINSERRICMKKKTLALRLLELRQSHDLTQKQLCESLSLGRSTYSYFETGSRIPDVETLLLIAQYYNVTLDELVTGSVSSHVSSDTDADHTDVLLLHHLKSKNIPVDFVLDLSKADFDFLRNYKKLSDENKAEMLYLMNYKLRKQT